MSNLTAIASTLSTEISAFRKAAATSDNKATPFSRAILAALMSGLSTTTVIESAIIHDFKNPTSKAGKPLKALTASGDHVAGWGKTRKTVKAAFDIFANVDADAPRAATDDAPEVKGAAAIRPLIVSFILSEPKAPKSLAALVTQVKTLVDAHVAANAPAPSEDDDKGQDEGQDDASEPKGLSLAERMAEMIVALDNCTGDELDYAGEIGAVEALYASIRAAHAKHFGADVEEVLVELAA